MKSLVFLAISLSFCSHAQTWEEKTPYPAQGRDDGVAFSLNSFGYCVTGNTGNFAESNLLYQYDAVTNSWTKKAKFPAEARQYATVFTIGNNAYLVGGFSKSGKGLSEVWCYDGLLNQWQQKNDFEGGIRWGAFSFAIAGNGYFGCGTDIDTVYSDFWEYNPLTDSWTQLEDFAGGARREGVACAAAGVGMAGLGFRTFTVDGFLNDWFLFNPETKTWEKAVDYPGGNSGWGKAEATGNSAIVGSGMDENQVFQSVFYQFDVLNRSWLKMPDIPQGPIRGCSSFSIDNTVYFNTGLTEEFKRSSFLTGLVFEKRSFIVNLFPNPNSGCFHLSSSMGKSPLKLRLYTTEGQLVSELETISDFFDYSHLATGLYLLEISTVGGDKVIERLLIE